MTKDEEKEIHDVSTLSGLAILQLMLVPDTPLREIRGIELFLPDNDSDVVRILREQLYP